MSQNSTFAPGDALREIAILYADGEAHRRDLVRQLLITLGVTQVHLADSGITARRLFREQPIGLVLAEQRLPDMDAITLIQFLRATKNYPKALVPMLLVGEVTNPESVRAALAGGANHFVVKPLSPAKLYERMCWALTDTRPFAVKDGRYVLAAARPTFRLASNSPKSAAK